MAPTVRLIDPRLPVERSASVVAPESLATAGLSSSEGGNRAGKARVRALGGGTHLRRHAKEAPATAHQAGGREGAAPDANTTSSAAAAVQQQPRSRQRAAQQITHDPRGGGMHDKASQTQLVEIFPQICAVLTESARA